MSFWVFLGLISSNCSSELTEVGNIEKVEKMKRETSLPILFFAEVHRRKHEEKMLRFKKFLRQMGEKQ